MKNITGVGLEELLKTQSVNTATDDIKFHGSFLPGYSF